MTRTAGTTIRFLEGNSNLGDALRLAGHGG
jgi:hypothetical protein